MNFFTKLAKSFRPGWWKRLREQLQNQRQNRQLIGEDRDGNKYYQYYSHYGLPIRRQIRFKTMAKMKMDDLVYYNWLYNRTFDPPTDAQKQQFYLEERTRKEKALEWDRKEEYMMIQFRKKKEELLLRNEALIQLQRQLEESQQLTDIKTKRQN